MDVLLVTSFQVVKRRMNAARWKGVQRLAYPFYLLTYVHLVLLLAPSAFAGRDTAIVSLVVYTVVVATYAVLRVRRALLRQQAARPSAALAG
jgi:methionine sulfoxide reductase heme-binding subunit